MSIARTLLNNYRKIQNRIFKRLDTGVLSAGELCDVELYKPEEYHGDVVHPCIRYTKDGCMGHKWWMVYTPYYHANPATENPLLYYGDSDNSTPPSKWYFFKEIRQKPQKGYNSDPNLLIHNDELLIFWRENQTQRCLDNGLSRATYGVKISRKGMSNFSNPILYAKKEYIDSEVSPSFLYLNNQYVAYATKVKFFNNTLRKLPKHIRKFIDKVLLLIDLIGIYPIHKSYGISIWKGKNLNESFSLIDTKKIKRTNWLHQPWHLDTFEYNNEIYAVIQTNQCNADICLAKSVDGINFKFYKKPLITNNSINKIGIYKPCGIVVNGIFHLFYTAQDKENRIQNKLYHTHYNFELLLEKLQ